MNSVSMARRPASAARPASSAVMASNLLVERRHARRATTLHRHMRQQEAEQEAARRNAEDERRHRFLFYALDHSAGMGDDAWEVEMRLRTAEEGALPAPLTVAAAARANRVEEAASVEEAPPPAAPDPGLGRVRDPRRPALRRRDAASVRRAARLHALRRDPHVDRHRA